MTGISRKSVHRTDPHRSEVDIDAGQAMIDNPIDKTECFASDF